MERETWTVEEIASLLGISRTLAYEAVRSGQVPAIRVGRRYLIPKSALEELLQEHQRGKRLGSNGDESNGQPR